MFCAQDKTAVFTRNHINSFNSLSTFYYKTCICCPFCQYKSTQMGENAWNSQGDIEVVVDAKFKTIVNDVPNNSIGYCRCSLLFLFLFVSVLFCLFNWFILLCTTFLQLWLLRSLKFQKKKKRISCQTSEITEMEFRFLGNDPLIEQPNLPMNNMGCKLDFLSSYQLVAPLIWNCQSCVEN